jgi:hypothetical protein
MAQPTQIKTGLPDGEFIIIDNGAAPTFPTLAQGTHLGYDTLSVGAVAQATNPFGDTGSTTLDTVNDTVWADPQVGTYKGNPVSAVAPVYATVSTVLNSPLTTRLLWKNPA